MQNKKTISIFIICLIILFPINSSLVLSATSISNVNLWGTNKLAGFREPYDFSYVNATIKMDGREVQPSNVKFGAANFGQCKPLLNDYYVCTYSPASKTLLLGGEQSFTVKVVDENGSSLNSYTGSFLVDGLPPEVISISASESYYGDEDIIISYKITDYALEGVNNLCSGISNILLLKSNSTIKTIDVDTSNCVKQSQETIPSSTISTQTGKFKICMRGSDRLGNSGTSKCTSVKIDLNSPTIASWNLVDELGEDINYLYSDRKNCKLYVNFTDSTSVMDTYSIKAKFETLNPRYDTYSQTDGCTEKGDVLLCNWNIPVDINSSGNYVIPIYAKDTVGNILNTSIQKKILVDNSAPTITKLISSILYNYSYYLKEKNNTIVAYFTESGSGINASNIFLNLQKVNGNPSIPADNCTGSACYWYGIDNTKSIEDDVVVTISPNSADNSGNVFEGNLSFKFKADMTSPIIEDYNWTTYGDFSYYNITYPIKGDAILFNFTVKDYYSPYIEGFADFSEITGDKGQNKTAGSCNRKEGAWNCIFTTKLNATGENDATFTFSDILGNNATETITLDIKYEENATGDYWTGTVKSTSPSNIDKQTTTLINHRVYSSIHFSPNAETDLISIGLKSCSEKNDKDSLIYDIDSIDLKKTDQWLKITLASTSFNGTDSLDVECSYEIISLIEKKFIYTEEENVTVSIGFYNMPLGEISEAVGKEIKRVKDSWLVQQSWLDTAEKLLSMYDKLCKLVSMINNVKSAFATISDGLCVIPTPATKTAATTIGQTAAKTEGVTKGLWDEVTKFCKSGSCLLLYWLEDDKDSKLMALNDWMKKFGYDIESSLPLSMLFICLKGIVRNLQAARVIECNYISCLENDVPYGKPIQICTSVRGYMQCKWVYGQLFQLVPFASVFSSFMQNIDMALTNPATAVNMVGTIICNYACSGKACGSCTVCTFLSTLNMIVDLYKDLEQMSQTDDYFSISDTTCEQILKEDE